MPFTTYVSHPEWEWLIMLALFAAGIAAGTYSVMGLMHWAGDPADRPVIDRMGLVPMVFMLVTPILLIVDLGQPGRFLNLLFTSPAATERPGPIMFNPNSPMSWGSWALIAFAPFTLVTFLDSLERVRGARMPAFVGAVARNPIVLAAGEILALVVSAYSGVLVNVTNQGVWSDTYLMGALFIVFSELSGMAVAAIVAGRLHAASTAGAVRTGFFGFAAVGAVLLALFLGNLAALGSARAVVASLLVGPAFWIGAVGAALVFPLVATGRRSLWPGADRLVILGAVVLVGVLAFRYAMFYSAIAYLEP